MFPALGELELEKIPQDVNAQQYLAIEPLLPVLVRRCAQSAWQERHDVEIAASEVFNEEDGVHSFYHVDHIDALVAIASALSRGGEKPFSRAAYFLALPDELVREFALSVSEAPGVGDCIRVKERHRHVLIESAKKVDVFSNIQKHGLYNYRVGKKSMKRAVQILTERDCREYARGPCACENGNCYP